MNSLPKRALGRTGIEVSCLGLGTVKLGRNQGVKYPSDFQLPDDKSVRDILDICTDAGMNLIDTAPAYGHSEERLGKLLSHRDRWCIATKVGEEFEQGESRFDFSAAHTRFSIERSLQRLNTDYLDIVLVHSNGNDQEIIEHSDCFETLQKLRDEGLIRAFGMSTKTVSGGLLALEHADIVMVTYHPGATDDKVVIDTAYENHKGVLIKKALNSGHLAASTQASNFKVDPVRASMDFIYAHPGVGAIIIGSITPAHLRQNIANAIAAASIY